MAKTITVKRVLTDKECEAKYKSKFLAIGDFDTLLSEDADVWSTEGELLLKFRKGVIDPALPKLGYEAMSGAIALTEARGQAAGESFKRLRADGSVTNTTVNNKVETGAAGYMDRNAMVRYCRKTAFTSKYFEKFSTGYPFIKRVDELYQELCPSYHKAQKNIAIGTNKNYIIGDTSFTTVTVNRNFQTAVHKDSGDFPRGFGNLTVYRTGNWTGSYFVLPEFRVAVDLHNGDMLFADVHKWHGNTPFENFNPAPTPYSNSKMHPDKDKYLWNGEDMRISFVMYYREYMIACKQPTEELHDTQMEQGGFLKL